ncbi:AI-2E family transporter [Thermococcus gorgonarius]|uniref:AI-2E family transporter n=1 Tax=Thermococcus gorgonarius TaxID=71997 RepID=A0A2Z2ME18_THEGO|nr:AI-2E family transporter [Thermococcus gorgonarius]ASJ00711.1 AI-2E family transporter [Thermococcus gorgonarius]
MRTETAVWAGISIVILYLVWKVVQPLVSPIIIALALVYVTYPLHSKMSKKIGEKKSAMILTGFLTVLSFLFILGFVLWVSDVKQQLVNYLGMFFNWLQSVTVSSQTVNEALTEITKGIEARLETYIASYTYSIPKLSLEVFVLVFVYYGSLINAHAIAEGIYSLIPSENEEFIMRLIDATKSTLDTLLKSWLTLSVIKGSLTALGFWGFGIAPVSGAIALGILVVLLELLPFLGGWMVWLPGAIYVGRESLGLGIIFAIYGALFISPVPDMVLAPKITMRRRGLNALISLVGIFGGLWAFGLVGVILGPVSLGLLVTLLEEWRSMVEKDNSTRGVSSDAD